MRDLLGIAKKMCKKKVWKKVKKIIASRFRIFLLIHFAGKICDFISE